MVLKITLGTQELAYEFQEVQSKRYRDVSEVFPKSYMELENQGFDAIVSMVGEENLSNHGIMPKDDLTSHENQEYSIKNIRAYYDILIILYCIYAFLFAF